MTKITQMFLQKSEGFQLCWNRLPHLIKGCLRDGEVHDAKLLRVVPQNVKDVGKAAGVRWQLVLQHVLMSLLQLNDGKRFPQVGVDRTGLWVRFNVRQTENDGVSVSKSSHRMEEDLSNILTTNFIQIKIFNIFALMFFH